jgi:predicted nucleic acid-binding protein
MVVIDTSAVLAALVGDDARLEARLLSAGDLHAPHLIDVELVHALRALLRRRHISAARAAAALDDYKDLAVVRYPHEPFIDRMWELRKNLTAYDAAFVSLSEALGAPLITLDARLAGAPGHEARVELY